MPTANIIQAVNAALSSEMKRDDRVVVLGEDVGKFGGVFRATAGLQADFGEDRVMDTPLAESGIIGAAIGMALYGLRPVPEIQFADFIFPAFDQIVNEAAKMRYRSGGDYSCPMVIRTPYGGGIRGGHYHSQSPEALFCHVAGLKVVVPSDPYHAKGLLIASIRDDDPVIFLEPKRVYRASRGEVPDESYVIPLGQARRVREGSHCTVVAWGAMTHVATEAAAILAQEGIEVDQLDLLTLSPLDRDTLLSSLRRTGRAVIVQEAPGFCGFASEVAAIMVEEALLSIEAPIRRLTGPNTPFPYTLENDYLPDAGRIALAVRETVKF